MEKIEIKKVETLEECKICNKLFENLVCFDATYDKKMCLKTPVENFFENTLNKEDNALFLALIENTPVGYISAYRKQEGRFMNCDVVTIMHLFVVENFRNKKIGSRLIESVEHWAKENYKNYVIELDCFASNFNALKFYEKHGYSTLRVTMRKN